MKKLFFFILAFFFSLNTFAQSDLKPIIKNEKSSFIQAAKTSTTTFQLTANESEIENLKKTAGTMSTIKLSAKKNKGNLYDCTLVIIDKTEALYVQRIFGFLGFQHFIIDGTEKSNDDLAKSLTSLK